MANEEKNLTPSENSENEKNNEQEQNVTPVDNKAEETPPPVEKKEESPQESTPEEVKAQEEKPEDKPADESQKSEDAPAVQEAPAAPKAEDTQEPAKAASSEVATDEDPDTTGKYDETYNELKQKKENNEKIEVVVKSRIRGGLRVVYKDMPIFLPASHFSLKRNPAEEELNAAVGAKVDVKVHETQEENGRKTVIVSRRSLLENEFWNKLNVGDIVEGTISSIAPFGVFLDLGGVEGLIHISRLSQMHVDDPKNFAKKGDKMQAVVVEIDRENSRIALSRTELEESPWKGVEEEIKQGSVHKGKVRRIADFGAYVELKPGVDGLLRTAEMSWTKRIKSPSDILNEGQEVDVYVVSINEDKQTAALSLKRLQDNPWTGLKEKYPEGTELKGTVIQVQPQGALVAIGEEVDGFMPRSKMKPIMKGKKVPYAVGDEAEVTVVDIVPDQESLILAPKVTEEMQQRQERRPRKPAGGKKFITTDTKESSGSFSIADLLSDKAKKNLNKAANNE